MRKSLPHLGLENISMAPILLFVYNRPEHVRQTVEALSRNELANKSDLIIYSDGSKTDHDAVKVYEVREYLRQINGFKSVLIHERSENYGLANSVIQGVTDTVNEYGKVIVLEDDLVTSTYFLRYMNEALERYEDEKQVMQITGYMFPVEFNSDQDAFFLPFISSWGWATWQRAWQHFDPDAAGYQQLKNNRQLKNSFNLGGAYPYYKMLESQLRGEIDSWAIRWNLSVFINHGLVFYPKKSMVMNIGFDGSGTHCVMSSTKSMELSELPLKRFPSEINIIHENEQKVYAYLGNKNINTSLARLLAQVKIWFSWVLTK